MSMRGLRKTTRRAVNAAVGLLATVLAGCAIFAGAPTAPDGKAREGLVAVDQLQIVDCLLPGQIRKLGTTVYETQRRPIRTTAADCEIRGGEYVAYDRADYRSALNVWLPLAEAGKAKAQNYVGEIFEKGLGRTSDYVSAAAWYRKAAEQGYTRAMINLGFLFEKGLGVEQDVTKALNWYRKASGVAPGQGDIVFDATNQAARQALQAQLETAQQQVAVLQGQIGGLHASQDSLKQELQRARQAGSGSAGKASELQGRLSAAEEQIATLAQLAQRAEQERQEIDNELEGLPAATVAGQGTTEVRSMAGATGPGSGDDGLSAGPELAPRTLEGIEFGRYYALIIGNQDYQFLGDLQTPLGDAQTLSRVLEDKYGFRTFVVADGNQVEILNALNDLYEIVGENDNLLIYYAGHGNLSEAEKLDRVRGYWLPVDAQPDRLTHWINNTVISDHLDRIKARAILVLADSCYAGAMASLESPLLLASDSGALSGEAIKRGLAQASRIVISSGGVAPVFDKGAVGTHSLFTGALLDVLTENDSVMRENMLFAHVAVAVRGRAQDLGVSQTPEMRPIRSAGHAGGDFYFVPTAVKNLAVR